MCKVLSKEVLWNQRSGVADSQLLFFSASSPSTLPPSIVTGPKYGLLWSYLGLVLDPPIAMLQNLLHFGSYFSIWELVMMMML